MRKLTYITVKIMPTSHEAGVIIDRLRNCGLHPTDLALAAPLTPPGAEPEFPVEVPAEEAEVAKRVLKTR